MITINDIRRIQPRLNDRMDKTGGASSCWEWQGARHSQGYGMTGIGKGKYFVHRLVMALHLGRLIKTSEHVCHGCDNPSCGNPSHLFLGDAKINAADMDSKGRRKPARGNASGKSKLTAALVIQARRYYLENDISVGNLAEMFGVTTMPMYDALVGNTWKHVNPDAVEAREKARERNRRKHR